MTNVLDEDLELMFVTPYIRAIELRGKDRTLVIERVEPGVKIFGAGGKTDIKPILHFRGDSKPMVCNVTNGRTIGGLYGRAARGWVGHSITIFPTVDRGHKCVRVRAHKPRQSRTDQPPPVPPVGDAALAARLVKQIEQAATIEQAVPSKDDTAKLNPGQMRDVRAAYRARQEQLGQPPPKRVTCTGCGEMIDPLQGHACRGAEPPHNPETGEVNEPEMPSLVDMILGRIEAAADIDALEAVAVTPSEAAKLEDSGDYERVNEKYEDREAAITRG